MLKLENSIRGLSFSRVAFDLTIQAHKKLFSHYDMYPFYWLSSKEGTLLQEKSFYA